MTSRRWVGTTAAMGGVGIALALLTPSFAEMTDTVLAAQRTADTDGVETLLLAGVGLAAWGVWAWGALGLLLTAASALPGVLGAAAHLLTRVVLPRGARRAAALALGLGLGVSAPVVGTTLLIATAPAAAAAPAAVPEWPSAGTDAAVGALPDWPTAADESAPAPPAAPLPDWPAFPAADGAAPTVPDLPPAAAPGERVVLRGDCLWNIAAADLTARLGRAPTDGETARAAHAWWAANEAVIGSDPDLLLPGQVLRPPP